MSTIREVHNERVEQHERRDSFQQGWTKSFFAADGMRATGALHEAVQQGRKGTSVQSSRGWQKDVYGICTHTHLCVYKVHSHTILAYITGLNDVGRIDLPSFGAKEDGDILSVGQGENGRPEVKWCYVS